MSTNIHILKVCEYCEQEFEARTTVTKYCSQKCRVKAYKKRDKKSLPKVSSKPFRNQNSTAYSPFNYITIKEASVLIGCSANTIYDMLKKDRLSSFNIRKRKTKVLRSEIEKIIGKTALSSSTHKREYVKIKDCWSINEIVLIYGLSASALYNKLKKSNIQKFRKGKSVFVSKVSIQRLLGSRDKTHEMNI